MSSSSSSLGPTSNPPPSDKLITTLLQTTDRATDNFGSMNLTRDSQSNVILIRSPA
ncbi:hypothetical protein glysoja_012819 [Glycine soja]|nr:hypothetical protein glysoja_012819 [Glycine soja]